VTVMHTAQPPGGGGAPGGADGGGGVYQATTCSMCFFRWRWSVDAMPALPPLWPDSQHKNNYYHSCGVVFLVVVVVAAVGRVCSAL
jgi:hypothetical protein